MIILDESDRESVNTLVHSPEGSSAAAKLVVPRFLPDIIYFSFAITIPPFAFALLNVSQSPVECITTIVAFVVSIPLYVGAAFLFSNPALWHRWMPAKTRTHTYLLLLQILWTFASIMRAVEMVGPAMVMSRCYEETISMVLSSLVVILLGNISAMVSGWNIEARSSHYEPASGSPLSQFSEEQDQRSTPKPRFITFLAYTSLGFSFPPFLISIVHEGFDVIDPCAIPVIVAYGLTTLLHLTTLIISHYTPRPQETQFAPKYRRALHSLPYFLFLLTVVWLFSTVMTGQQLLDERVWRMHCQAHVIVSVIFAAIQVLILGTMAVMSGRDCYTTAKPPPTPPTIQIPTYRVKGPIVQ